MPRRKRHRSTTETLIRRTVLDVFNSSPRSVFSMSDEVFVSWIRCVTEWRGYLSSVPDLVDLSHQLRRTRYCRPIVPYGKRRNLSPCGMANLCPQCWGRRASETWRKIRDDIFSDASVSYDAYYRSVPMFFPDIAQQLDSRIGSRGRYKILRSLECRKYVDFTCILLGDHDPVMDVRQLLFYPSGTPLPDVDTVQVAPFRKLEVCDQSHVLEALIDMFQYPASMPEMGVDKLLVYLQLIKNRRLLCVSGFSAGEPRKRVTIPERKKVRMAKKPAPKKAKKSHLEIIQSSYTTWAEQIEWLGNYLSVRDVAPFVTLKDFLDLIGRNLVTSRASLDVVIERYCLNPKRTVEFVCDYLDNVPVDDDGNPDIDMVDYAAKRLGPEADDPLPVSKGPKTRVTEPEEPEEPEETESETEDEDDEEPGSEEESDEDETEDADESEAESDEDEEDEEESEAEEESEEDEEDEDEDTAKPMTPSSRASAAAAAARAKDIPNLTGKRVTHAKLKGETGEVVAMVGRMASVKYGKNKLASINYTELEVLEDEDEVEEAPAQKKKKPRPGAAAVSSESSKLPTATIKLSAEDIAKANKYLAMDKLAKIKDPTDVALLFGEAKFVGLKNKNGHFLISNTVNPKLKTKGPWLDFYLTTTSGEDIDAAVLGPRPTELPARVEIAWGDSNEKAIIDIVEE